MIKMNPITVPVILTIALAGIIAIVLIKLFFQDKLDSEEFPKLPSKFARTWEEEPYIINQEYNNDYNKDNLDFSNPNTLDDGLNNSWEEPNAQYSDANSGVASKVFQEPMTSKHQDVISKDYDSEPMVGFEKIDKSSVTINNEDKYEGDEYSSQNPKTDIHNDYSKNLDNTYPEDSLGIYTSESYTEKQAREEDYNSQNINNEYDDSYRINSEDSIDNNYNSYNGINENYSNNYLEDDYITPEHEGDSYSEKDSYSERDSYSEENKFDSNNDLATDNLATETRRVPKSQKTYSKDLYSSYDRQSTLGTQGINKVSETVVIDNERYNLTLGKQIIFNYNNESYSGPILDMKQGNVKVRYRGQEEWIKSSEIKKVF